MKIHIDIGHPAHVHYFRNFIKIMENKGHKFFISARDKEMTHTLLNNYQIKFTSRGKGRNSLTGKLLYIIEADITLFRFAQKFKPDLFLSFGSAYAAHVAFLLGKPHIAFDDTEHAKFEHIMYVPFTKCILTPDSFKKDFGDKHIRFTGSMDVAYLHPKCYHPDINYLDKINLKNKIYFFLRFVKWGASHDLGQSGFSIDGKRRIIKLLSQYGDVLISSENDLPEEFEKYLYKGDPCQIHTVLQYASMFISESGSMATEAAVLGTPSVMVNTSAKYFGVFGYLSKFNNLFYFDNENQAIDKIAYLLTINKLKEISIKNAEEYFRLNINLTEFMVWFIENYPQSSMIMKKNPDYQNEFI
ncbi:MAG TPA: hypothetical protein DHV28_00855 [Ignavibacteriales bacterium]|nr:hypothetical protein [Ignavibacteriales bacterium]